MTRRAGFTLLEVMIALVITGLVVTLAYAAVQGGLDTRERLTAQRERQEALVTVRAMIRDALRHGLPGVPGGPDVFVLVSRVQGDGTPADSVEFLTRGVTAPYGTSTAWRVSVSVDSVGLRFVATPGEADDARAFVATVPGVNGLDVRTVGRGVVASWTSDWSQRSVAPQAAAFTFVGPEGPVQPLIARLFPERAP